MKIRELYLKNFGKFSNEKIVLKDGVNLFYGENESGKTTIHTFIKSMLFGLERGRGRASINDAFSLYEPWENPNYYAGVLRFESGGKNFCLERTFDKYSKSARLICEDDGEEFSMEHGDLEMLLGDLDLANYENTISIGQMKVETNQSLAAALQNFATNYYATGNSEINLDGAVTLLGKKKKEVEKELRILQQERGQECYHVEQEKSYHWRDVSKLEEELEGLEKEIERLEEKQVELEETSGRRWRVHPLQLAFMLLALLLSFLLPGQPWNYMVTAVLLGGEGMYIWNRMKDGKKRSRDEVLAEVKAELQKLQWKKERLQNEIKEKEIQMSNLQEQIEELNAVDETQKLLEKKKQAIELAVERLLYLSKGVHQELSAELNRRASAILKEITGGKYTMLLVDEKMRMYLYTGEKKIGLEQVSRGTIEQIYFALRMAASEILFEESYPVILDDTFVYYDDVRLENTLRWLVRNKKQLLIFTCQKREAEMLKKIGVQL